MTTDNRASDKVNEITVSDESDTPLADSTPSTTSNEVDPKKPSRKGLPRVTKTDIPGVTQLSNNRGLPSLTLDENRDYTSSQTGFTGASARRVRSLRGDLGDLVENGTISAFTTNSRAGQALYDNQSIWEVGWRTLAGGIVNLAAGAVGSFAANDPKGIYDMAVGNTEEEYGNVISDFAKTLQEYSQENLQIYQEPEGSIFSINYWASQLQNFGYSAGIMLESLGEQAALAYATGGAGNVATAGATLSKLKTLLKGGAGFGMYQGVKEAYMNGLETGEQTYQKYKAANYSEEEAKKKANEAASLSFTMEALPSMLLNGVQFATVGKYNPFSKNNGPNTGYSGAFDTAVDFISSRTKRSITNPVARKSVDYGLAMLGESLEEGIQTVTGNEAQYQIMKEDGLIGDQSFIERHATHELRDAMIGGAFGGGVFRFAGKRIQQLTGKNEHEKFYGKRTDEHLATNAMRTGKNLKELNEAIADNDLKKAFNIRRRMNQESVLDGLYLDLNMQSTVAHDNYVSGLRSIQKAVNEGDTKTMRKYGIETAKDIQHVQENFDQFITDAETMREDVKSFMQDNRDVGAALTRADLNQTHRNLINDELKLRGAKKEELAGNTSYQALTPQAKELYDLKMRQHSLEAYARNHSINKAQREEFMEVTKQIKEWNDTYEGGYVGRARDMQRLNVAFETSKRYAELDYALVDNDRNQQVIEEDIVKWADKTYTDQVRKDQIKEQIAKARTKEDIKKAKEAMEEEGVLDEKTKEEIEVKEQVAKVEPKPKTNAFKPAEVADDEDYFDDPDLDEPTPDLVDDEDYDDVPEPSPKRQTIASGFTPIANEADTETGVLRDDLHELPFAAYDAHNPEGVNDKDVQVLKDYYENLKEDLGQDPSFKEFLKDIRTNMGRDSVENLFPTLVAAWQAAGYAPADYNRIRRTVLMSRKELAQQLETQLMDSRSDAVTVAEDNNAEAEVSVRDKALPTLDQDLLPQQDNTRQRRTVDPTPKAAYNTFAVTRDLDESGRVRVSQNSIDPYQASDIDNLRLNSSSAANPGDVLRVEIPDEETYKSIYVPRNPDSYLKDDWVQFGEYMANNGIEEGSEEFYAKVPMLIYLEGEDRPVAFVHDADWYNSTNIGYEENPLRQQQVINEGRANVAKVRGQVRVGKSAQLRVTAKVRGTYTPIPMTQQGVDLPTLNENNPQIELAFYDRKAGLLINGDAKQPLAKRNVILKNNQKATGFTVQEQEAYAKSKNGVFFKHMHLYEIRKGANKNEAIAFKPYRPEVTDTDAFNSMQFAIIAHLFQNDVESKYTDNELMRTISADLLKHTGIDIKTPDGLRRYLKRFAPAIPVGDKPKGINYGEYIHEIVAQHPKISVGQSYVHVEGSVVIIGRKGFNVTKGMPIDATNPDSLKSPVIHLTVENIDADKAGRLIKPFLKSNFNKLFEGIKHNVAQELGEGNPMATIDTEGKVVPQGSYNDYVRNTMRATIKSYNVGTKENPDYATVMQPTVQYDLVQSTQEVIKTKVENNEPLTRAERAQAPTQSTFTPTSNEQAEDFSDPPGITKRGEFYLKKYNAYLRDKIAPSSPKMQELAEKIIAEGGDVPTSIDDNTAFAAMSSGEESYMNNETATAFGRTFGLDINQVYELTDYIFNEMSTRLDFVHGEKVSIDELEADLAQQVLDNKVKPKLAQAKENLAETQEYLEVDNEMTSEEREQFIKDDEERVRTLQIVVDNWSIKNDKGIRQDGFFDQALIKMHKYTGTKPGVTYIRDESTQEEKIYAKQDLEAPSKQTASYRLKRHLSGIQDTDANGNPRYGFAGVPLYVPYDTVYDKLYDVISEGGQPPSNFEDVLSRIKDKEEAYPWLTQVADSLDYWVQSENDIDDSLRQEFVYNFVRHNASYKFVMWSQTFDGSYTLRVFDSNSNDILQVIRDRWKEKFKMSSLVKPDPKNGTHVIDTVRAQELLDEYYKKFYNKATGYPYTGEATIIPELRKWLMEFGIELDERTLAELQNGYYNSEGIQVPWLTMFEPSFSTDGMFGLLADYLERMVVAGKVARQNGTTLDFEEQEGYSPFKNIGNVSKIVARIEAKYSLHTTTNTFFSGGKTFSGLIAPTHSTEVVNKLKGDDPSFRMELRGKTFNGYSYMLDILDQDESFRKSKFGIIQLGNEALKQQGKRSFGALDITSLPELDHEMVKTGMFFDTQQGEVDSYRNGTDVFEMRMGRMFLPTMADKSRMSALQTAVFKIAGKHLNEDMTSMNDDMLRLAYSQLVAPEVARIAAFHSNPRTNISGYNMGARLFHMIPALNTMTYRNTDVNSDYYTGQEEVPVIQLMEQKPAVFDAVWFTQNIKPKAEKILQEFVQNEVNSKVAEWNRYEFIKNGKIRYMDSNYFVKQGYKGTPEAKLRLAAHDYVLNSLMTNSNVFMLMAGDIAMYTTGKIGKYFKSDDNGNPNLYAPKAEYGNEAYTLLSRDVVDINLGKRLALLIAPGIKVSETSWDYVKQNDGTLKWSRIQQKEYAQVFLNDYISYSTNIKKLAENLDGVFITDEDVASIRSAAAIKSRGEKVTGDLKKRIDALEKKLPYSSAYFFLETTDAQEYTTAKEHLRVLYGQGRIKLPMYKRLSDKLIAQKEDERNKRPIRESALFDTEEMQQFFQPVKPVYTGFKSEVDMDVMRPMYIKSSSFPLLPQVTANLELDKLRRLMETYEERNGTTMRASYQTANKVGANTNAISVFKDDGVFDDDLLTEYENATNNMTAFDQATIMLPRENFKVQQDVPFDPDKAVVSQGTQTLKLLFGNGMTDLDGFELENFEWDVSKDAPARGKQLQRHFARVFDDYVEHKRKSLYDELSMNDDGTSSNIHKTQKKFHKLLMDEAENRGYSRQSIEGLEMRPVYKDGKKTSEDQQPIDYEFEIPLWLNQDSNKFESMLQAIVTKRLVDIKMPGMSYVVGSEAGFKHQREDNNQLTSKQRSRIVYTNSWKGDLQASTGDGKTKLNKAQVLAPSRLKDNDGNLIEFVYSDGTFNETYVEVSPVDGIARIKPGTIDESLFSNSAYRTPTSGHVSMSQVEIVGFLPPEVGNLMITPKNFTQQMGQDFDIDKLTNYQHHTYVHADGTIGRYGDQQYLEDKEKATAKFAEVEATYLKEKEDKEQMKANALEEIQAMEEMGLSLTEEEKQAATALPKSSYSRKEYLDAMRLHRYFTNDKAVAKEYENQLVSVYASVLSNPNKEVQDKINSVLSMDFARAQRDMFSEVTNSNTSSKYFSILSDSHQKRKMALGAAGKSGIGVYSNYVVFHSMTAQTDAPVQLLTKVVDRETKESVDLGFDLTFGEQTSDGTLGRKTTLTENPSLVRDIATSFEERQNTATDNEKEQIMGIVGVNGITINVDALLTALGFDKSENFYVKLRTKNGKIVEENRFKSDKERQAFIAEYEDSTVLTTFEDVSIPYALLSQPIIKEYVARMEATKSTVSEYSPGAEQAIVNELKTRYGSGVKKESIKAAELSGANMFRSLLPGKTDYALQIKALDTFLAVDKYATKLSSLQRRLNINNSGLGKSYFETLDKYEMLASFPQKFEGEQDGTKAPKGIFIKNATALVGDFIPDRDLTGPEDREAKRNLGYRYFSTTEGTAHWIRPTTPVGSMVVRSVHAAHGLWNKYFPYSDPVILRDIQNTVAQYSDEDTSEQRLVELQQTVFKDMRKYMLTSNKLDLYRGTKAQKQAELFLDVEGGNQSLATYLSAITGTNGPDVLKTNKLISRFEYRLNQNGLPSLITYNNSASEGFDEDYLYVALMDLMRRDISLPPRNGKNYSTRELAEDLIAYAYLGEPVQEAIQFIKYIPVAYLKGRQFASVARSWDKMGSQLFAKMLGVQRDGLSNFGIQNIQHNAAKLIQINLSNHVDVNSLEYLTPDSNDLKDLMSFKLDDNKGPAITAAGITEEKKFVRIRNKKAPKGFRKDQIYMSVGNGKYQRISTLGTFGMNEYDVQRVKVYSRVNDNFTTNATPKSPEVNSRSKLRYAFLAEDSVNDIMAKVAAGTLPANDYLKQVLGKLAGKVPDIQIEVVDFLNNFGESHARASTAGFSDGKIVVSKQWLEGTYNPQPSEQEVVTTLAEEIIHGLTTNYIDRYYLPKTGKVRPGMEDKIPKELRQMDILLAAARRTFPTKVRMNMAEKRSMANNLTPEQRILTAEESLAYGTYDLREFVAHALSRKGFIKHLENSKYQSTDQSIWDRVMSTLSDIINKLFGTDLQKETVAAAFSIIDEQAATFDPADIFVQAEKNTQAAEATLNGLGSFETPDAQTSLVSITDAPILEHLGLLGDYRRVTDDRLPMGMSEVAQNLESGQEGLILAPYPADLKVGVYTIGDEDIFVSSMGQDASRSEFDGMSMRKADFEQLFENARPGSNQIAAQRRWLDGARKGPLLYVKKVTRSNTYASYNYDQETYLDSLKKKDC